MLVLDKVGDVPVLFSDKFQQSIVFSLFIFDLWTFLLCCRDRYPLCHLLRLGAVLAGYAGYDAPRLCSSWLSQAKIFGILVGLDQKDSCSDMNNAGYAGCDAPRAVFFSLVRRPMMLGIMAVVDQKNTFSRLWSRQCKLSGSVAVPQLQFFDGRQHPCRGALASLGPDCSSDHRDSPVAREQGDRCPCYAVRAGSTGGASFTGAVVEKTVVLPQLHLLRNSFRAAHELRWGFFWALYTGTGPVVVSTGTQPHN